MENTALYQDKIDHFSQGHGLLQVKIIQLNIICFRKLVHQILTLFYNLIFYLHIHITSTDIYYVIN